MIDHHHTYITPTSISQIQQLTLTGPAQGKGGVQSQDSHAMVHRSILYFHFVCHPYILRLVIKCKKKIAHSKVGSVGS